MTDLTTFVDLYCERHTTDFWNEPFNALSNLAFILAALLAYRTLRKRSHSDRWEQAVILMAGLIGIGSFLFHTFATRWAELADIIPIWSFVAAYIVLVIYRFTGESVPRTAWFSIIASGVTLLIISVIGDSVSVTYPRPTMTLNGSVQYAPALLALVVFSGIAHWHQHPARHYLSIAAVMFLVALAFRTIDLMTCVTTDRIGTHFLWHLFNALMIYVLLQAMVLKMPPLKR